MKGYLLYRDAESASYEQKRLKEESAKLGIELEVFQPSDFDIYVNREDKKSLFIRNERRELPDFFWSRMGAGTSYFGLAIIRQMERLGVPVINSS